MKKPGEFFLENSPYAHVSMTTSMTLFSALLLLEFSRTAFSMTVAGIVLLVIGILATLPTVARVRGLEKVIALSNLCFAMALAAFGAEHFAAAQGISQIVPKFMPWPLFWTYFVGTALIAGSLSIATKILVQWSGLLWGIMMFIFVATMDLPGTLADPHNRIIWALLGRELSFGCGGWMLAVAAMNSDQAKTRKILFTFGRIVIGVVAVFYGVEHFLHPVNVPGVPLEKLMPTWVPAPSLIGYLTGLFLVVGGVLILLAQKTRTVAGYLGGWILLEVILIYLPILITSLLDPSTGVKVEGLNYFFDTLLYVGTILALASAAPGDAAN